MARIRIVLALTLCICTGMLLAGSRSWAADPVISTIAGGWIGDAGPATSAGLAMPQGIAIDSAGNIYIADVRNNRIRKVDMSGVITTLAGIGTTGYSGDGGPATSAGLAMPQGVAIDASGNIYIADTGNDCIRKVDLSGIITTVAGNGTPGYSGDGLPATSASLNSPQGLALDAFGNIYIADTSNSRIRKVDTSGMIITVAGNGTRAYSGDGGPAVSASLNGPSGVSVDATGNIYIADTSNNRIRMIDTSGMISTVAGNGTRAYSGEGGPAVSASLNLPQGVFADTSGNLYIADTGNDRVRLVVAGMIVTVAGNGTNAYSGDGGPAVSASLRSPQSVFVVASGNIYIVDALSCCVRKVDASGVIATVAGGGSGDGGPATSANLGSTRGLALDVFGNTYIAEGFTSSIRKVDASGVISTLAGNGTTGFSGDGGPATSASLNGPWGIAVDSARGIYIADTNNNRIRKVDAAGVISTIAGNGIAGYAGDGGPAVSASLRTPQGVAVDADGNLYIADASNYRIRKVDPSGIITTVAGNGTTAFSGDGGPAVSASLFAPRGVAVDRSGNIFIVDAGHYRIRKVDTAGIITTIAGNGTPGYSGDGGPAVSASLNNPWGIAVDASGNIFITETGGSRVRKIDASGIITTVAGNGLAGYSGDGGPAISASLNAPNGVAVDVLENIYIADTANDRIRMVGSNLVALAETVVDSAGNPVEGAVAQVVNGSTAVTDANGAFVLAVPRSIVFQYTISKSGYRTWYSNNRLVASSTTGPNRILYSDAEVAGWGVQPGFAAAYGRAADSATNQTINNPAVTAESTVNPGVFYSVVYDPACGTGNGTCRFFIINIMPNDPVLVKVSAAGYQNGQFRLYSLPADGIGSVFVRLQETQGVTQPLTVSIGGNGSGFVEYSTGGGCQGNSCTEVFPSGSTVILTATAYSGSSFAGWSGSCSGTELCTVLMDAARAVTAAFNTVPPSPGIITTVAGGWIGDGGPALLAGLRSPWTVTTDASGNVYIAELRGNRIRKVSTSGVITSVAGIGENGFSGDFGPAAHAKLNGPSGLAVDAAGNIYISDTGNNRVRKVDTSGVITTIAGNGAAGYSGDGGPASAASLYSPRGLAVDGGGNVYIADSINRRLRKVDTSGTITTVAGNGTYGYTGDGGPATSASFGTLWDVAIDAAGNLFIADMNNHRVRRVDTSGIITTIAGNGTAAYSGDGGPAVSASLSSPRGVVIDRWGNLYIADGGNLRVRKIDTAGIITTIAGTGSGGYAGDGGPALEANLDSVFDVSIDNADNIFIANAMDQLIRKVDSAGIIDRFAGGWLGDDGSAIDATVNRPQGAAVDGFGNLLIADSRNNRIRKVDVSGSITTVAGDGTAGYSGDGGSAVLARLDGPASVAVDGSGTIFIADTANHRIRKVDASGIITTVAGDGTAGYSGEGGPAVSASLNSPYAVALDSSGNLYIADLSNNRIRKVEPSGVISTVAGSGIAGSSGDNGPAVSASLNGPRGVAVDASGAVYIADSNNQRIRKVDAAGVITTIAGTGFRGYAGDGGPALSASLSNPAGVAIDTTGAIYLADDGNQRIRKIDSSGVITTVAGNGTAGYSGDGGPATSASLSMNRAMDTGGITVDAMGNLFIADTANSRVRMVGGAVSSAVTLTEIVADSTGNPLEGAVAQVVNGTSALSDASGSFVLAVPRDITFRYTISKTGYRTWYSNSRILAASVTGPRRTLYTDAEAAAWGVNTGFAALRGRAADSQTGQTINNPSVSAESTVTPGATYPVVYDSVCGTGSGECYYSVINIAPNDPVLVTVSAPGYAASQVTTSPIPADGIGSAYIRLNKLPRYRVTTNSPAIAAGNEHTVVLKSDGTVIAWGENDSGACNVPAGLSDVTAVSSGAWHTVALQSDGTVAAWGQNNSGECAPPAGLSGVIAVAAGDLFTVAAKSDGTVVTWGAGDNSVPEGLAGVTAVAGGNMHKMALKSDGTVVAWGFCNPDYGQCSVPAGLSNVTAIAAGQWHNLALKSDGTVVAWGNDTYGQSTVPPDLTGVVAVAAGAMHSAALKGDGTVVAWGSYYSGTGTVPPGLSDVVSIAAGYGHTVALKSDGTLVAWGYNGYGESTIPEGLNLGAGRVVCSPATADYNGSSSCIITPGTGHHVADVKVGPTGGSLNSVGSVTAYSISNITADMSIAASFDMNTYTITASAGPNGTIEPSGALTVSEGGTGAFSITPDAGYHIADVLVDDSSVGVVSSYTFTQVNANHTISAAFAIDTYTITASAGPNGSVSCNPALVNYGSGSTCAITPDAGYHVLNVLVDDLAVGPTGTHSFTNVTADHTISATFAINTYTITASAGPNGSASCNPALVNYGSGSTCTITPDAGYHVLNVLVDDLAVGPTGTHSFTNVTADHTISATFAINTYTITASAGPNGSVSCNPALMNYGSGSTCTITPDAGYHVLNVLVDDLAVGPTGTYSFTNVTADHTISATFAINTYTVSTAKSGTGTGIITTALPGISCGMDCSEVYDYGSVITLTAAAGPDSVFTEWSGACSGTGPCTLTVGSDQTVSATFTRAITVTSPNGGEIWVRGTTYAITWTYAGEPGALNIELLQDKERPYMS